VNLLDAGRLILLVASPTLIGAAVVYAPRAWTAVSGYLERRRPIAPQPIGPPIQQLAADLRRLLRLHGELTASAHVAMRAHRLWAVEAAIGIRAVEAARALDIAHREPDVPGALTRDELLRLLTDLAAAGLVLPAEVGPFTFDGRL
jgi:hypothetical protein